MRQTTLFAVLASALMILGVAAPAVAAGDDGSLSVSVSQTDAGDATVSVTERVNGSPVAVGNASVTVETTDGNATYDGAGAYTTGENGTVALPAPNETVNVSVTATYGNATASTTATLAAGSTDESDNGTDFGQRVSSFVHRLQASNGTSGPLGAHVAAFVTANNPGNAPDHAGPPERLTNDSANETTGPPTHAGPPDGEERGPPDNRSGGPPDDKGGGPPDDNGGGPPDDKGGGPPEDKGKDENDEDESD